jgi:DNA-binding transcriptional LysR family regulator
MPSSATPCTDAREHEAEMRIEQLEYLAAVTQSGSLRRASDRLHISQPALSEALTKLERELGVTLLDRRRSGAKISREGRDLLRPMVEVLEAVDRLKRAAGDRRATGRVIRIGTVNAGTARLLLPAVQHVRAFQAGAAVEIRNLVPEEIRTGLHEGALDLGLDNMLGGDDLPHDLDSAVLMRGRPVAVLPVGHPLAAASEVSVEDLREVPFVAMRAGYLMERFAHRLFGRELPGVWHVTDGAEMGKMMVAEGLGVTILPDYSVVGDPLERAGLITTRAIAGDASIVSLQLLQSRRSRTDPAVRDLAAVLRRLAVDAGGTASVGAPMAG